MLYRGINKNADAANAGRILPKGHLVKVAPKIDSKWTLDGKFKVGVCGANAGRAQHIESGLYGGAGISSSRSEEVAIKFATTGYTQEGYVYVIDESLLVEAKIVVYEFPNPLKPEEKEVTLIENAGGALPMQVIVEKYAVDNRGNRISEQHCNAVPKLRGTYRD